MNQMKSFYRSVTSGARAIESCKAAGINVRYNKYLLKITNTRSIGGRLIDGLLHYRPQYEISGNTYAIRDLLKKWGFAWDANNKVWWIAAKNGVNPQDIARRILKVRSKYELN